MADDTYILDTDGARTLSEMVRWWKLNRYPPTGPTAAPVLNNIQLVYVLLTSLTPVGVLYPAELVMFDVGADIFRVINASVWAHLLNATDTPALLTYYPARAVGGWTDGKMIFMIGLGAQGPAGPAGAAGADGAVGPAGGGTIVVEDSVPNVVVDPCGFLVFDALSFTVTDNGLTYALIQLLYGTGILPVAGVAADGTDGAPARRDHVHDFITWNWAITATAGGVIDSNGTNGELIQQTGAGAPSHAADDGVLYLDLANDQLYFRNVTWLLVGRSNLLDGAVHTDTLAGTVARGDVIVGNSTPKWSRLAVGSGVLKGDGTDVGYGTVDLTSEVTGVLLPALGGTGLFGATNPGDLLVWDGAAWSVLPIGGDGQVLTADSTAPAGVKWN